MIAQCAAVGLLTGLVMVLTACADDGEQNALGNDYDLIDAMFPICQDAGQRLARYLDTGQPTDLDPDFGDLRQHVLSLSGEARALAIRQHTAEGINNCDERVAEDRRWERHLAERARAAKVERIRNREALQRYRNACEDLGGYVEDGGGVLLFSGPNGETCKIDYPTIYGPIGTFLVPLDKHGNVHENTRGLWECAHLKADGRGNWWHKDTQVCATEALPDVPR